MEDAPDLNPGDLVGHVGSTPTAATTVPTEMGGIAMKAACEKPGCGEPAVAQARFGEVAVARACTVHAPDRFYVKLGERRWSDVASHSMEDRQRHRIVLVSHTSIRDSPIVIQCPGSRRQSGSHPAHLDDDTPLHRGRIGRDHRDHVLDQEETRNRIRQSDASGSSPGQKCEKASILVAANLPFDEWTEALGSERLTGALLDRLTHHVHILEMNGESYRLRQSRQAAAMLSSD